MIPFYVQAELLDRPDYCQTFALREAVILLSWRQRSAGEFQNSLLSVDYLQQHRADSGVARIRLHDELSIERGSGENRGRRHECFNLLESLLLRVSLSVSPILLRQSRKWFSYRGEVFQELSVPRSHTHEAAQLLQVLWYRKV